MSSILRNINNFQDHCELRICSNIFFCVILLTVLLHMWLVESCLRLNKGRRKIYRLLWGQSGESWTAWKVMIYTFYQIIITWSNESEIAGKGVTHGKDKKSIKKIMSTNSKDRDKFGDIVVDVRIILKWFISLPHYLKIINFLQRLEVRIHIISNLVRNGKFRVCLCLLVNHATWRTGHLKSLQ